MHYEFHITGTPDIVESAKLLCIKTIVIDSLKKDGSYIKTEYITSHIEEFTDDEEAIDYLNGLTHSLLTNMIYWKWANKKFDYSSRIFRCKVERQYFPGNKGLYIESHWKDDSFVYPTSKNQAKESLLATDRVWLPEKYPEFIKKHEGKELELCIFDSNPDLDSDWFTYYYTGANK